MEPQSSLNASLCSFSLAHNSQQECVYRRTVDLQSVLFWMSGMPRHPASDYRTLAGRP